MRKWSREKLADKCFELSLLVVEAHLEGIITEEQMLQILKGSCTSEGRDKTKKNIMGLLEND